MLHITQIRLFQQNKLNMNNNKEEKVLNWAFQDAVTLSCIIPVVYFSLNN